MDGFGDHVCAPFNIQAVIDRRDDGVVSDERAVSYEDPALVLEPAARVDKDALTQMRVEPAVGGEGRE